MLRSLPELTRQSPPRFRGHRGPQHHRVRGLDWGSPGQMRSAVNRSTCQQILTMACTNATPNCTPTAAPPCHRAMERANCFLCAALQVRAFHCAAPTATAAKRRAWAPHQQLHASCARVATLGKQPRAHGAPAQPPLLCPAALRTSSSIGQALRGQTTCSTQVWASGTSTERTIGARCTRGALAYC